MTSASSKDVSGVCGAGFKTVVQPAAIAGRHFVRHQVERKIKRSDGQNRAQRKTAHDSRAAGGGGLPIERQPLAANARGLFRRHGKGENRAIYFDARGAHGLPCFQRDEPREFFAACADSLGNGAENRLLFVCRHLARDLKCALGGKHGLLGMRGSGAVRRAHDRAVVRGEHFKALAFGQPFTVEIETPSLDGHFYCSSHEWSLD